MRVLLAPFAVVSLSEKPIPDASLAPPVEAVHAGRVGAVAPGNIKARHLPTSMIRSLNHALADSGSPL